MYIEILLVAYSTQLEHVQYMLWKNSFYIMNNIYIYLKCHIIIIVLFFPKVNCNIIFNTMRFHALSNKVL